MGIGGWSNEYNAQEGIEEKIIEILNSTPVDSRFAPTIREIIPTVFNNYDISYEKLVKFVEIQGI